MAGKRQARKAKSSDKQSAPTPQSPVWPAYASAAALWMSFAPVGLSFLGWLAPLGWLHIASRRERLTRRDYFHLWLSGCVFWLAILQGVRLAYWPLYLGWLAISCYLAIYIPLFVALTHSMRSRRLPLLIAAPVCWVGLEFVRSHLLTGFCSNMLAHT